MSLDTLAELNWLAVVVAAVGYYGLGANWYAPPVFGRAWSRAIGLQMPEGQRFSPAFYVGPLATCFIATVATAMLALARGSDSTAEGITLGLVVAVGYAATVAFVGGVFDPNKPQPMLWFVIFSGYHLLGLLIAAVVVTAWG